MAINFPDSPTNGQVATVGGKNYTYNSTKNTWTPTQVTEADLSTVGSTTVVATHDLLPTSPSAGDMALVSSVNKMYVYFLSGWWLMSSLQNASPSGITGNAAIYDLAADGTPTTVTLSSSDPEGFPIVWSHSVISGSLGGTTVTNVNNVFTITPSTDAADAGTFTLRFAASDGQGGESGSQSQFTLDFAFIVTNSRYTTLLATADGTSDNNNITDASTNNHSITVNGDAHAGTFSPYRSGGYSWDFDGSTSNDSSTSRITATPSSTLSLGTGDYTVEMWVKSRSSTSIQSNGNYRLFEVANSSGGERIAIRDNGYGDSRFSVMENGSQLYRASSGTNPYTGEWEWLQIVRDNGATKAYVNGSERGSASSTTDISGINKIYIGSAGTSGIGYGFNGNIRDFRISNIARSTTVPTEPLESDSNTLILACNKGHLIDQGPNSIPLTLSSSSNKSDPTASATSPYDYEEYDAADHGGSVYFDGTGDYLRIGNNKDILNSLINNDNLMTIESWVYPTISRSGGISYLSPSLLGLGDTYLSIGLESLTPFFYWWTGSGNTISSSNAVTLNAWSHIAVVLDANSGTNNIKIYINGTLDGQGTFSGISWASGSAGDEMKIGNGNISNANAYFQGYVQDFRITVGTAHYTSNFTPPTAPSSSSGSELHIKGTDASIIDKSQGSNLKLVGNTTGSTTQTKFSNTKSMYFDGTGDYAQLPVGSLHLGSLDFTIETWIYQDTNAGSGSSSHTIYSDWINTNNDKSILLRITDSSGQKVQLLYSTDGTTNIIYTSTSSISSSTWTHVAVCKDSTSLRLYIDGVEEIWANNPSFNLNPNAGTIGPLIGGNYDEALTSYGQFFDGYIQDFRITKGLARYTANFTPPTAPLEG